VLTEVTNRGVDDVCIVVCDGLKGLPDAVTTTWPLATVQACVLPLVRNTFRYAARQDFDALARQLRGVYTAPTAAAAAARFDEVAEAWGGKYPAVVRLWRSAWEEFIPFLDYDVPDPQGDLLDQRHREPQRPLPPRRTGPRALPHRPGGAEVPLPRDPIAGPHRTGAGTLGKPALNAFAITFEGRLTPTTTN